MPTVHSRRVRSTTFSSESYTRQNCDAGCTLSPSAFGESLKRELPETRLGECDSTFLPSALNPWETRARRGCTDESENKARVGEGCSHVCWFVKFTVADLPSKQSFAFFVSKFCFFLKIYFFFRNFDFFLNENHDFLKCTCHLFLSDKCVDDFGMRHEATARRDMRLFDSCITDC